METSRVAVRRLPLFFAISPNMRILRVRKYEKDSNHIIFCGSIDVGSVVWRGYN